MNFYIFNKKNILIDTISLVESSHSGGLIDRTSPLANALQSQVYINKVYKGTTSIELYLTVTQLYSVQRIYGYQTNKNNKIVVLDDYSNIYYQVHAVSDFQNTKVNRKDMVSYYHFTLSLEIVGLFSYPTTADYQHFSQMFFIDCADKTAFAAAYTKYTIAGTQSISVSGGKLLLQSSVNGAYSSVIQDMTSFPTTDFTMTENVEVPKNMNIIGTGSCSLYMYMGTGSLQFLQITINTDIQSSLYKYRFIFRMLNAAGTEVKLTTGTWAEIGSETLKGRLKLVKSAGTISFYFDKDFTGTYATIGTYTHSEFTGIPNRMRHDLKFVTGADSAYMKIDNIIFNPDFLFEV